MDSVITKDVHYYEDGDCLKCYALIIFLNIAVAISMLVGLIIGIFCSENALIITFGVLLLIDIILWIVWFCFDCIVSDFGREMKGPSFKHKHMSDPWYIKYCGLTTEICQYTFSCFSCQKPSDKYDML